MSKNLTLFSGETGSKETRDSGQTDVREKLGSVRPSEEERSIKSRRRIGEKEKDAVVRRIREQKISRYKSGSGEGGMIANQLLLSLGHDSCHSTVHNLIRSV